jgi:adenylate cyclase
MIRRAIDLNPFHPNYYWYTLGRALQAVGRYADAIAAWSNLGELQFHHHARLAACHARLGDDERARCHVERVLALQPTFSSSAWVESLPYQRDADRERLRADLLAAGLPP